MRFKLRQYGRNDSERLVSSADHPCRLDFSRLSGPGEWSVYICYGEDEVRIACVNWIEMGGYTIDNRYRLFSGSSYQRIDMAYIMRKDHIVPTVLGRLNRLVKSHWLNGRQRDVPVVTVVPCR